MFPVALVEAVLTAFSDPGDLIYEPFCGSGTQIVAAERAGRRCFAMELDPVYCDVAVRRWEIATGIRCQRKVEVRFITSLKTKAGRTTSEVFFFCQTDPTKQ